MGFGLDTAPLGEADGVVDALLDPGVEGDITPLLPLDPLGLGELGDTGSAGSLHDLASDDQASVTHALNARVDETLVDLVGVQRGGKRGSRCVNHVVGDLGGLGENGTETKTGEDVDVVALVGVVGDGLALLGLDGDGVEGGSRGEEDGAVGPLDGLLESALGLGERVAEGEENGATAEASGIDGSLEGADNGLGENTEGGSETDQGAGLDVGDDLLESAELVAVVVGTGKVLLVLGELVATVLGDETLGVDQPELVLGGLLAETTLGVVLDKLLGNTDTGRASSHEDQALLLKRDTRELDGVDVTGQDDGTSSLDVVVEAAVLVAVAVEVVEGLLGLKVLELDGHVGVDLGNSLHELVHEGLLLGNGDTLRADAKVEGVLQVVLVVGSGVEDNGEGVLGVDAGGTGVEGELSDLEGG